MRITRLTVRHFLGIKAVDVPLGPMTIFCGDNFVGKSSLQQAVRMALAGEVARVKLKGDYNMLIHDDAKNAEVIVATDDGNYSVAITESGACEASKPVDSRALPYILDPRRFASENATSRRALLLELSGASMDNETILARVKAEKCDTEKAEQILPLMLSGFDAASKEADTRASGARSGWKVVTGETYGSKKANGWKPNVDLMTTTNRTVAGMYEERAALVAQAEGMLAEHDAKVEAINNQLLLSSQEITCPECGAIISDDPSNTEALTAASIEADMETDHLRGVLESRRADLALSEEARRRIDQIKEQAESDEKMARHHHENVVAWTKLRDLFSPDGIPAEMIGEVRDSLNGRMREYGSITGLPVAELRRDMEVTIGGRWYPLCSESEQWQADAAIAAALAQHTGLNMILLDRVDVLSVRNRGALGAWALWLSERGVQVVMFATLKQAPQMDGAAVYWLDDGVVA